MCFEKNYSAQISTDFALVTKCTRKGKEPTGQLYWGIDLPLALWPSGGFVEEVRAPLRVLGIPEWGT